MFIKKFTAIIFAIGIPITAHASASLPCSGKTHDVQFHIGNYKGDSVSDLTVYNNDTGKAEYATTRFISRHIEWRDYEVSNDKSNNLYVTAVIGGTTKIAISVTGNNGTITINNKTESLVCDWLR